MSLSDKIPLKQQVHQEALLCPAQGFSIGSLERETMLNEPTHDKVGSILALHLESDLDFDLEIHLLVSLMSAIQLRGVLSEYADL